MQSQYKANFVNLTIPNLNHKFDSCMLTISVGQLVHEGEKFKATLELVNRSFRKCTIGVCDTLQRHSLAILANLESDDLYNIAKQAGDQWIDRNIEYCQQNLTIPFEIVRWDAWLKNPKYSIFREQINALYEKDTRFFEIVQELAIEFNNRLRKRGHQFDPKKGVRLSVEYILEECAAMCQWYEEKYSVEVYPAIRNEAIEYGFSVLMSEQYNKLVLPAGVNLKKNKNFLASEIAVKKILDTIPGHVYWKDLEGNFLGCNKRQAENYGFKNPGDLIGKKDSDILKEETAREIQANDKQIIASQQEEIVEEETYVSLGKKRIKKSFLSHKIPMMGESGEVIGIVGVSIDVSEQKKLQQSLLSKTKELSLALEHKRDFLNVLSHEIRTPLHVISSIVDELSKNVFSFSREELNSFITVLAENNKRLMKLLTHLLDSAKNIKGQSTYNFQKSNIITTCMDCIKEFYYLADISFVYNGTKEIVMVYDELKISQVIRNILDNAIKYGKSKGIKVLLEVKDSPGNVTIRVENAGCNFREDERKRLFEVFFQGEKAKKMQNGVGLGLSICKEIITAHKGKIWADNIAPNRVSVNFSLPYKE